MRIRKQGENPLPEPYNALANIDYVPANIPLSKGRGKLIIFEDSDAVIKMTVKGRSPQMRHVPRTHRVDLDWLFERLKQDPGIRIKYVGAKEQIADIFTKASFTAEQWKSLCLLAQTDNPHDLLGGAPSGYSAHAHKGNLCHACSACVCTNLGSYRDFEIMAGNQWYGGWSTAGRDSMQSNLAGLENQKTWLTAMALTTQALEK